MNQDKIYCIYCNSKKPCTQLNVPVGQFFICERCGMDYCDADYMDYKRKARETMRELLTKLNKDGANGGGEH